MPFSDIVSHFDLPFLNCESPSQAAFDEAKKVSFDEDFHGLSHKETSYSQEARSRSVDGHE